MRRAAVTTTILLLGGALACAKAEPAAPSGDRTGAPASAPSTEPTAARADPERDSEYVADGPEIPARVGVRRVFLRQGKVNYVRDPVVLKDGKHALVAARVAGNVGLYRVPLDGGAPSTLVQPLPRRDPAAPESAKNRNNWYIGTPRLFPDGKHVIFDGSAPNPFATYSNVLGIAPVEGGVVIAVEARGAKQARTPDVHPDGKTVVFAACDEIRSGQLAGVVDQVLETTVLLELAKPEGAKPAVCTVHRPRFSPDGKRIVFEVIGRHLEPALLERYHVPAPVNEGDGLIEPWIMNADGTGVGRLVDDAVYAAIGGRLQSGGSKEAEVSPDGESVVFSHGRSIALVRIDGKDARIIATSNVAAGGTTAVQFSESDPTFTPDGKAVVTASSLIASQRVAPPGLAVVELDAADPRRAVPR